MTTTYARRKAHGDCPRCGRAVPLLTLYCATCRDKQRAYVYALERAPARGILPQIPGPLIACCGHWQAIPPVPCQLPCCGRVLAIREETP
jgi:hypothetical protein